jgi:hypothetical protein
LLKASAETLITIAADAKHLGARIGLTLSRPLITQDQPGKSAGLRVPAGEIEQLVTSQLRRWLLDAGSMYRAASTQLPDPSAQRELL